MEQGYNEETVIVGRALQKDFEQRGVHLDSHGQQQALHMSEEIATLGMAISKQCNLSFTHSAKHDVCTLTAVMLLCNVTT